MRYTAVYSKILLLLFILGMSFSNVAQTPHPAPHVVKQSKSPVKSAKNNKKNKKALNDEESKKSEEEEDFPDGPGGSASSASQSSLLSSTELWLLLAACIILPGIPFVFSSKKYSGESSNPIKKFWGWLEENKVAIQGAYITGIVVIFFVYVLFFKSYKSDEVNKESVAVPTREDSLKEKYLREGFPIKKRALKSGQENIEQKNGADSIDNNKGVKF